MFFIIDSKEARKRVADYVARLTASPLMCVEVKPYKKNRSVAQNRLLWLFYSEIAKHIGTTPEELHEEMKVRVLGVEQKVILGKEIIQPKSTTKLDVQGMTNFLEAVEALARELNVVLPIPDDYGYAMGY